ncbi:MAG: ABC transporter ATP-binding protein [Polyangiaceae bacterium]
MIEVSHASKSFGPVVALDDVSLGIARGERVAFVGSNGSGKTTLLRAILGLLRIEGRITIGGIDVGVSPEIALRGVSYIPQIAPPIEAPVAEVIRAYAALRRIDPNAVAEQSALLGLTVSNVTRTRFRDLSGGMKQKLLAAMALAAKPDVLVCDEPTANLDAAARAAFFAQVDQRAKDCILILCSHRIEEVRQLVDRVVEMKDGRVARDASLGELLGELRTFRVEVALRRTGGDAEAFLRSNGFELLGAGRFGSLFSQAAKVDVVARLLRLHQDDIVDLSIFQVEDLAHAESARLASSSRLKVAP